ncbi:MAG: DUF4442 domain-containing protein [Brumimicrobium sp.]|nr:DUF4442 domain-containing protein [Brumimicrobium sp.]
MKSKDISLHKMRKLLWLMGVVKIPLIAFVRPKLVHIDEKKVVVRIRLRRRTKNHLQSMYFGALAVGADVAAGLHAFYFAEQLGEKISFAFKGVNAEFLKRATSHVTFTSEEGLAVKTVFEEALTTRERQEKWVKVEAKNEENEVVAIFQMQISIKVKG